MEERRGTRKDLKWTQTKNIVVSFLLREGSPVIGIGADHGERKLQFKLQIHTKRGVYITSNMISLSFHIIGDCVNHPCTQYYILFSENHLNLFLIHC